MMDDKTLNAAVANQFDDFANTIEDGADPSSELYAKDVIGFVKRAFRPSEDYLEVHFEVTRVLVMNADYYIDRIEESTQPEKGTGGLWVLAKRITDKYIKDFDEGVIVWHTFLEDTTELVRDFKI